MTTVIQTGICIYNEHGIIINWNEGAQGLTGYKAVEVVGQPIGRIFPLINGRAETQEMSVVDNRNTLQLFSVEKSETMAINDSHATIVTFSPTQNGDKTQLISGELSKDPMSGVYDRDSIISILDLETKKTLRYKIPLSVIAVKITGYDEINAIHGLGSTDLVVQTLAIILKNEIRDVDTIGRISEDTFAIILPCTELGAAAYVASRIAKVALRYSDEATPFTIQTNPKQISEFVSDWLDFNRVDRTDKKP